ncbi:KAT8 regulatory NSL complex subunit 1-like protein isoform X2 [Kryptolebias marmoratus]|uniref:KAT8 regulatory NSL complex subunit 1-like protein isoform X2 n=1 Tax=Kryptolebias marmoratus TaxID=37003 RepID=UPI0007F92104|nr:KAT8 regulatory NSL complex subunit 1-like protein isoform X2 [Kryptolebias marmoratus]
MAPALTKILKNGHGIHLTSPPASVRVNSEARATCTVELEPHMGSADDGDLQKMLNLCLFRSLDSCLSLRPLDPPLNPGPLTCVQTSASPDEIVPLTSPDSLASFLSFNKCQRDPHQVAPVFPGVPDMFLIPVPEHNSQEACLLHGQSAFLECRPDGGDVHGSSLTLCPSYSHEELTSRSHTQMYATRPTMKCEGLAGMACPPPPASVQPGTDVLNFDQMDLEAGMEEVVKEQLSKHEGLKSRAWRLQKGLQALLGDHALLHCSQQLEGLEKHCQLGDASLDSLGSVHHGVAPPPACSNADFSGQESFTDWPSFVEVTEFCDSSQVVLRGLQEALDSEATGSSSSEDEPEEDMAHGKISFVSRWERQWLEERVELSSRWSWLQLRLSELEGRIEQMVELHQNICSTKGRVVLADPHPLTGRQAQQTLMREMTGSSCTASEADTEPCSPTRLLHNIERQSAQLSQIVNSLGFSPLSKQDHTARGRTTFTSGQGGGDGFLSGSSRRRRMATRKLFKADASSVCARTRPLISYHKRRLFKFKSLDPKSSSKSRKLSSTESPSFSSSSCLCGSWDPVSLCSDPDCSSSSRTHPLVSFSFDFPTCHHLQRAVAREEWLQKPFNINSQLSSPANSRRNSSTPRPNSSKYKKHARRQKRVLMGLSPIRSSGSAWTHRSSVSQRRRKMGRTRRLTDDDQEVPYQLCDLGESSVDVFEETYTQIAHSQASQGFVRKRQRDSMYNINNIVIPASLCKVEKLQYKDILTPSWRLVDIQCLTEMDNKIEDLSDDVFARRHLALEQKEKLRWSSWEKRKGCRRPMRSVSRLSGSGGRMCTSGEESSVEGNCAQLDSDEQPGSEEWLPQAPWKPRLFPLDDVEEASLLSEAEVPSGWKESSSLSCSSKHSNSHLSPAQSVCNILPSYGQGKNCTSNGS